MTSNFPSSPKKPFDVKPLEVGEHHDGQRLDNFLSREFKHLPRPAIYRLLRQGHIRVNGGRKKPDFKLSAGDQIRLPHILIAESIDQKNAAPVINRSDKSFINRQTMLESAILFEDEGLLIINKPPGIAVHGGSGIDLGVIETFRLGRSDEKLELVHRLDRDTSGCLMIAKKASVLKKLQQQLREKTMVKSYEAIVFGRIKKKFEVKHPLRRTQRASGERMVVIDPQYGQVATTIIEPIQYSADQQITWIKAQPITGRTHQIRVHCQSLATPILGDRKYMTEDQYAHTRLLHQDALMLHARSLSVDYAHLRLRPAQADYWPQFQKLIQMLN